MPWAREGSGFTLMMEALMMLLSAEMPVDAMADLLDEHDTRLWRVVMHYVEQAHAKSDWSAVRRIAVDEISARRGHRYVTNVLDAENSRLLLMVEGRSAEALRAFATALVEHGGDPSQIEAIAMDMSPAYVKGATRTNHNGPKTSVKDRQIRGSLENCCASASDPKFKLRRI